MLNSHPDVVFRLNEIPVINCLACKEEMPHQHTKLVGTRYEKRSYICIPCGITEHFYFDITSIKEAAAKRA